MSFTSFPLEKLGLASDTVQLCARANLINAQDVLLAALPDLTRRLRIRHADAQSLIRDVSRAIAPHTATVADIVRLGTGAVGAEGIGNRNGAIGSSVSALGKRKRAGQGRRGGGSEGEGWIECGDEVLDGLLGGGIRVGAITEIVGESAAGKSHWCLHLALAAQLPSLTSSPGGSIILTSERELSTTRLSQLGQVLSRRHAKSVFLKRDSLSDGVLTRRVADVDELDHALSYAVPALLERARTEASQEGSRSGGKGKGKQRNGLMGYGGGFEEGEVEDGEMDKETGSTSKGDGAVDSSAGGVRHTALSDSTSSNAASLLAAAPRRSGAFHPPPPLRTAKPAPIKPIRLLIIDSLTALLRGAETSFSSSSAGLTARSRHLCLIADKLKALAVEYGLAVVVVNQVSDVFEKKASSVTRPTDPAEDDEEEAERGAHPVRTGGASTASIGSTSSAHLRPSQLPGHASSSQSLTHDQAWYASGPDPPMLYSTQSRWFSGQSSARTKEAALGIVWANAVNTRIMLSRTGRRRVLKQEEVDAMGSDVGGLATTISQAKQGGDGEVRWADGGQAGDTEEETTRTLIRRAHVVFSPGAPSGSVDFVIRGTGVHGLKDTYALDEGGSSILARARKRRDGVEDDENADWMDGALPPGMRDGEEGDDYGDNSGRGEVEDDFFAAMGELEHVPEEWWAGNCQDAAEAGDTRP